MVRELLYQLDITQVVIFLLTTVGGALVAWYWKRIKEWKAFWNEVLIGLRDVPALQETVKGIVYYVGPNGGGSLMDSALRTEKLVNLLADQVEMIVQTTVAENDADEDLARFHRDAAGGNTYVNRLYARWIGVGKSELLGWNYVNYIHPDDIDRVRKAWEQCRTEHRQYRIHYRLVPVTGEPFAVEVIATPIPDSAPAKRWIGSIRRLDNERRKSDIGKE